MNTLIILPGWTGSHKTWEDFIKLARQESIFDDVVCLDLPCFGDVPCPDRTVGVEYYAHFATKKINKYIDEHKSAKIHLMGHSFGGQVAVQIVADNPRIVDSLILVGAAIVRPKKYIKRAVFFIPAKIGKLIQRIPKLNSITRICKKYLYKASGSKDYAEISGVQKEIFKKIIREDLTHLLPNITLPTLVIWGSKDNQTPLRHGKKIVNLISGAQLKIIHLVKHGVHKQAPEQLLNNAVNFIKDIC